MKDKIMFLIIGILIGAIITTVGFLIYNKSLSNNADQPEMTQINGNGQMGAPSNDNMGEPPEKPDGEEQGEPPAKPDGENTKAPTDKSNASNSTNVNS